MSFTVEATYESGVLKLRQPLPLDEHETVHVTVQTDKPGPTARIEPATMAPASASSPDEPSDFAEYEMLDIWLDVPPSPTARTVTATRGEPILPGPFEIDESDLAPE
ncbi:MAG: antitoxin family protein [Planctomycetaceae bacterium]|nr:antitoxin family protein [Planctomycetaceae bacterium]